MKQLTLARRAALLLPLILNPVQARCDGLADTGNEACPIPSNPTSHPTPSPTHAFLIQYNEEKYDRNEYYREMLTRDMNQYVSDDKRKQMREQLQQEHSEQEARWDAMRARKDSLSKAERYALEIHDGAMKSFRDSINSLPKFKSTAEAEESSVSPSGRKNK